MKTITFHLSGTHCAACKFFIEDALTEQGRIKNPRVNLKKQTLRVDAPANEVPEKLATVLTEPITKNGYAVSVVMQNGATQTRGDSTIWTALPIGLAMLALFFILQKSGVVNVTIGGTVSPVTGLVIGIVASISSCLAVVGGLVLSLSAKLSRDGIDTTRAFLSFHVGRFVSFAFLGGALGALGGAVSVNPTFSAMLGLVASIVMLLLGLQLLGFRLTHSITLPSGVYLGANRFERFSSAPFLIGAATFVLPCGFTQAMQVAALSSGSFFEGMLLMTAFALGTLPMLALISFGSASFAHGKHAPLFLQTAGVVVVGLGIFTLLTGLAGLGIIEPIFSI